MVDDFTINLSTIILWKLLQKKEKCFLFDPFRYLLITFRPYTLPAFFKCIYYKIVSVNYCTVPYIFW